MAKRRVASKRMRGRTLLALAMIGFVLLAVGVIWRRATGTSAAREIRALEQRREVLASQRDKLQSDIRAAASRSAILPIAESRLNMHIAKDSQYVILTRPPRTSSPR